MIAPADFCERRKGDSCFCASTVLDAILIGSLWFLENTGMLETTK
jgi:hypothetical protein